jgi:hypothetical protein
MLSQLAQDLQCLLLGWSQNPNAHLPTPGLPNSQPLKRKTAFMINASYTDGKQSQDRTK